MAARLRDEAQMLGLEGVNLIPVFQVQYEYTIFHEILGPSCSQNQNGVRRKPSFCIVINLPCLLKRVQN